MELAPIVLFCYNRPQHTLKVLQALQKNVWADQSTLYIFSDGAKLNADENTKQKIEETRCIIRQEKWTKEVHIIEQATNKGLANSIIDGITDVINKHGRIIVLEDDTMPSIGFLKFMNEALELYKDDEKVMNISGYLYPIQEHDLKETTFFSRIAAGWGWATWKRAWDKYNHDIDYHISKINGNNEQYIFEINGASSHFQQLIDNKNGKIYTWGIRWYASWFNAEGLNLFPAISLIKNIGFDGTGENCGNEDLFHSPVTDFVEIKKIPTVENNDLREKISNYFKSIQPPKATPSFSTKLRMIIHKIRQKIVQ